MILQRCNIDAKSKAQSIACPWLYGATASMLAHALNQRIHNLVDKI